MNHLKIFFAHLSDVLSRFQSNIFKNESVKMIANGQKINTLFSLGIAGYHRLWYHSFCADSGKQRGPMVKRLRRCPLKAESGVQFSLGSPHESIRIFRVLFYMQKRKTVESLSFYGLLIESNTDENSDSEFMTHHRSVLWLQ